MANRVYTAVYLARAPRVKPNLDHPLAKDFSIAVGSANSFYDTGDDPAFFSAQRNGGPITWGVCRADLRHTVQPGDVVIFFAAKQTNLGFNYFPKGFATVERKISQLDVWESEKFRLFRQYLNLLIRPKDAINSVYEWYEPVAKHTDWLCRICDRRNHYKKDCQSARTRGIFVPGQTHLANGVTANCGANYVIFSERHNETLMLTEPFCVAIGRPLHMEQWLGDARSQAIKELVIGLSSQALQGQRGLKTKNQQRPHRQLLLDLVTDLAGWRSEVQKILRQ